MQEVGSSILPTALLLFPVLAYFFLSCGLTSVGGYNFDFEPSKEHLLGAFARVPGAKPRFGRFPVLVRVHSRKRNLSP